LFGVGSGWSAAGLVVAGGVEGEVAEEFAGVGVDDADVAVGDEHHDAGSGVFGTEALTACDEKRRLSGVSVAQWCCLTLSDPISSSTRWRISSRMGRTATGPQIL